MTTEQQDWNDDRNRRLQAKQPELFEVVRKASNGYDSREQITYYKTERLGVYSSELAALRAIVALTPNVSVQPLKVDG